MYGRPVQESQRQQGQQESRHREPIKISQEEEIADKRKSHRSPEKPVNAVVIQRGDHGADALTSVTLPVAEVKDDANGVDVKETVDSVQHMIITGGCMLYHYWQNGGYMRPGKSQENRLANRYFFKRPEKGVGHLGRGIQEGDESGNQEPGPVRQEQPAEKARTGKRTSCQEQVHRPVGKVPLHLGGCTADMRRYEVPVEIIRAYGSAKYKAGQRPFEGYVEKQCRLPGHQQRAHSNKKAAEDKKIKTPFEEVRQVLADYNDFGNGRIAFVAFLVLNHEFEVECIGLFLLPARTCDEDGIDTKGESECIIQDNVNFAGG